MDAFQVTLCDAHQYPHKQNFVFSIATYRKHSFFFLIGELTQTSRLLLKLKELRAQQYWEKKRKINQWNRIKIPETDPHIYDHMI